MNHREKIALTVAVLLLLALGYLEQFLFENVNEHLVHLYYNTDESRMSDKLSVLFAWSYDDLMWLKWGMTILSTVLYFLATIAILRLIFNNRKYITYAFYIYAAVTVLSFILYMGGSIIGYPNEGYRLSRFAMGIVTSPVPLMALIPAFKLSKIIIS